MISQYNKKYIFQIITKGNGSVILKYMNLDSSFLKLRGIRCYKTFNDKKK